MSGAEPPVGATSGSSAAAPSQQQQQQQKQEITAAQLADAILEIIRQWQQQQQQQEIPAAARSESNELRGWLMVVASLTASVTYSATLDPPGGVWQADAAAKGYITGRPVLADKFHRQYIVFHFFNVLSFVASVGIIVLSSTPTFYSRIKRSVLSTLVALDILALAGAFLAGSWTTPKRLVSQVAVTTILLACLFGALKFMRISRFGDQSMSACP